MSQRNESIPAIEHEIVFTNGEVHLSGTLAVPGKPGRHPAVVLISGSGPQNRDCEMSGFPLFKLLSRELCASGVAVLRYDDRGVGGSGGSIKGSTLEDFASDVEAAISFLRSRDDIRADAIGVIGHSEGGAVGLMVACRDPGIGFLAMLAGPGIPIRNNILLQTEMIYRANGMPEAQITREVELQRRIFDVLASGADVESLRPVFLEKARADVAEMRPDMRRALSDLNAFSRILYKQQMDMMDTPWFRSSLAFDPSPYLLDIRCPMLALFGGRDLQVPAHINRSGIDASAVGDSAATRVFADANHLFQKAETGSPMEYGTLRKEFTGGFLDALCGWVSSRFGLDSR